MKAFSLIIPILPLTLAYNVKPERPFGTGTPKPPRTQSNLDLPLFIIDLENPWLLQHESILATHPDLTTALCTANPSDPSLKSLLRRLKYHAIPPPPPPSSLFRTISIENQYHRPGYQNAIDRLNEILCCPAARQHLQALKLDLFVYRAEEYRKPISKYITDPSVDITNTRNYSWFQKIADEEHRLEWKPRWDPITGHLIIEDNLAPRNNFWDLAEPPMAFSKIFARILSGEETPNLKALKWRVPCSKTPLLEQHFDRLNLTMRTIKHLDLGDYQEYMIRFAPNLESLSIGTEFEARDTCMVRDRIWVERPGLWRDQMDRVLSLVDGLGIGGQVRSYLDYGWIVGHDDLFEIFQAFPNISDLHLPRWIGGARPELYHTNGPDLRLRFSLKMIAYLSSGRCWKLRQPRDQHGFYEGYRRGDNDEEVRAVIDPFMVPRSRLRGLHLLEVKRLGQGYFHLGQFPGHWEGPVGEKHAERLLAQMRVALERALNVTVDVLPWLEEVTFGSDMPVVNRTRGLDLKTGEARWPWTS